jgi:hypothetical protein
MLAGPAKCSLEDRKFNQVGAGFAVRQRAHQPNISSRFNPT